MSLGSAAPGAAVSPSEDAAISVFNSVAELDALVSLDIEFAVKIKAGSSFGRCARRRAQGSIPGRAAVGDGSSGGRPDVPAG